MYYITEVDSNDSVRSFPFIIDIKPTKHKQMCAVCKEELEVHKRRIYFEVLGNKATIREYYHIHCFINWNRDFIRKSGYTDQEYAQTMLLEDEKV